jgi:hypothetical protein
MKVVGRYQLAKKLGAFRLGFRDTGVKHFWVHANNFFIYQLILFIFYSFTEFNVAHS